MSDPPEYSYRSNDLLYEVYLPDGATRPPSIDLKVVNPGNEDEEILVRAQELDAAPSREALDNVAADLCSFLDAESTTLWSGAIGGRTAVRRTTTGSFSWMGQPGTSLLQDSVVVGYRTTSGRSVAGSITALAEVGSPASTRDLMTVVAPATTDAPPDGTVNHQLRGFRVSAADTWRVRFGGVSGEENHGPWKPSPWEVDEQAPGYKLRWGFTGVIPDLNSNITAAKQGHADDSEHYSPPGVRPPSDEALELADYLVVDSPGVEHPKVASLDVNGKEILVDDHRNEYAHRSVIAWCRLGPRAGFRVWMKVENEILDLWEQSWSRLLSAVRIESP